MAIEDCDMIRIAIYGAGVSAIVAPFEPAISSRARTDVEGGGLLDGFCFSPLHRKPSCW